MKFEECFLQETSRANPVYNCLHFNLFFEGSVENIRVTLHKQYRLCAVLLFIEAELCKRVSS